MRLRLTLAILLALFAILTLLERFVLVELLVRRAAVPMLLAIAEGLAIIAAGALMRRSKKVDVPVDFLLGYPVFGAICFLVGTLKISAWTMVPLLVIFGLGGVALLLMWYADDERRRAESPPLHKTAFLAVVTVLACGFVVAQAPPSSLDEVAYHLAVPQAWVLEGRAIELPLLSHSYFPLGIESADLPLLTLLGQTSGGVASHLVHLFAAIATTLLITRRTQSWLATAAIVTTPALAVTAGWSLVEWPLVGLFILAWDEDARTASAATAAGLLTKYTFIPFAIAAWVFKRRIPSWIALAGLIFFARNVILTGNPVAPFFSGELSLPAGFRDVALSDYVFEGDFIDESIGASLLILAPFASGAVPLAGLVMAIGLFLLAPSSRILIPFLVVPAISAAPELKRRVVAALVVAAIVIQTFLVLWYTGRGGSFLLLAGAQSEEEHLAGRPSQAAVTWVNSMLPPRSRTLIVGLNETYWFARPVRGGGNYDGTRMSKYLDVATPEVLRARLHADGITHVAVITLAPPTRVTQKRQERQTTLSPAAQRMLALTLDRYAASVTSRGNATLFTLR